MRIMGVDPSVTCTGISLPSQETLSIKPRTKGDRRLKEIADHVLIAAQGCRADLVLMEGLFGSYRGEAGRVIPMMHGAVRDRLMCHGIPYFVIHQATLKSFATGKGGASKDEMALAARRRLGRVYRTNDECDADWVRVAGRLVYGFDEITEYGPDDRLRMPVSQVTSLHHGLKGKEVEWPTIGRYVPWPRVALR
jgi:Holliday junction resolvasome RuvABC endonuclease subunit